MALVGVLVAGCGGGASAPESEAGSWFGTTQRAIGPGPDFVVREIVAPLIDVGVTLRATMCNEGDQAGTTEVAFVVSLDATLQPEAFVGPWVAGQDVGVGSASAFVTLGVDECAELESLVEYIAPQGMHRSGYLIAVADPYDWVVEGSEANNTAVVGPRLLTATPDLVVTDVSAVPNTGEQAVVQATVCNDGDGTSFGGFLSFYVTDDAVPDAGPDRYLRLSDRLGTPLPVLAPGDCATVSAMGFMGYNGEGYVVAYTEPPFYPDLDPTNNVGISGALPLGLGPDFYVTELVVPHAVSGAFSAFARVCNQGAPDGATSIGLYLSADGQVPAGPPLAAMVERFPARCGTVRFDAVTPPGATGAYRPIVVTNYDRLFPNDLRSANNTFVGEPIGVGAGADLVVTSFGSEDDGFGAPMQVTVCNRGTTAAAASRVALQGMPSAFGASVPALGAGDCAELEIPYAGAIDDVVVVVDPLGTQPELFEDNNAFAGPAVFRSGVADLVVTRVSVPEAISGSFRADVRVCNAGAQTSSPTNVEVYVSADRALLAVPPPVGDPLTSRTPVPALPGGQCVDLVAWSWVWPFVTGAVHVIARADGDFVQAFPSLYDNDLWVSEPLALGDGPDLVVREPDMRGTSVPGTGERAPTQVSVCNVGNQASGPTSIDYSWAAMQQASLPVSALAPGGCTTVAVPAPFGQFYLPFARLELTLDPASQIGELREDNNSFTSGVLEPQAESFDRLQRIEVRRVVAPRVLVAPARVEVELCGSAFPTLASVELYRSDDRVWSAGDVLLLPGVDIQTPLDGCTTMSLTLPTVAPAPTGFIVARVVGPSWVPVVPAHGSGASERVAFGGGRNLAIDSVTAPSVLTGAFEATVTVCNSGTLTSLPNTVTLVMGSDAERAGTFSLGAAQLPALAPGVCRDVQIAATAPALTGGVYLGARVSAWDDAVVGDNARVGVRVPVGSGPNLIVRDVRLPNATVGNFTTTVEVCNTGSTPADANYLVVYTSPTPVIGADASWGGAVFMSATPAGQCQDVAVSTQAPWYPGPVYLGVFADAFGFVGELIEDDNAALGHSVIVGTGPDLVVQDVRVYLAQLDLVVAEICNVGTAPSPATEARLALAALPQATLFAQAVGTLQAGQCQQVGLPALDSSPLVLVVDTLTSPGELRRDNDRADVPSRPSVSAPNGEQATLVRITELVHPQEPVFVPQPPQLIRRPGHVTLCSEARVPLYGTVQFYASADARLGPDDARIFSLNPFSVAPGCADLTFSDPSLGGWIFGAPWVLVRFEGAPGFAGPVYTSRGMTPSDPDVRVAAVRAPRAGGGTFTVDVELCNDTSQSAPPASIELFASRDDTPSYVGLPFGDVPVASAVSPTLAPASCSVVPVAVTLPPLPFTYGWLWAEVDRGGAVTEQREDNNVGLSARSGLGFGPDLVVTALALPSVASGYFNADATVCNEGNAPSPSTYLYLMSTAALPLSFAPGASEYIGAQGVPELAPGACVNMSIPSAGTAGTVAFVVAAVDPWFSVTELDHFNNERVGPQVGFGTMSNLVVEDLQTSPRVFGAYVGPVTFDVTVCNRGNAPSAAAQLTTWVDTVEWGGAAITPATSQVVPALAAGDCVSLESVRYPEFYWSSGFEGYFGAEQFDDADYFVHASIYDGLAPGALRVVRDDQRVLRVAGTTGPVCGDLIVTTSAPVSEQCDDGNLDDGDGCSATCTVE